MRQENLRIFYLCNAIDEETKRERDVRFDSPAATNKVFGIAKALTQQGVKVHVLSFGKGKQTSSKKKFPTKISEFSGFQVHYAAFWHYPLLTHVVGSISMALIFYRLLKDSPDQISVIAYNRLWQYLPTLVLLKIYRKHGFLDLEDGSTESTRTVIRMKNQLSMCLFNWFCNSGAIISAKSLTSQLSTNHIFICYGIYENQSSVKHKWSETPIRVIFGGSLFVETGVQLLIDAINLLKINSPEIKNKIAISVTGQGTMSEQLRLFAETTGRGWINFLGNVDRESYISTVSNAHLGLCLKISTTEMGKTTFPSKIIEYASYGLAIATTKVSDVSDLFDEKDAILLANETPDCLAELFQRIAACDFNLETIATNGQARIHGICNIESVGINLKKFLLEEIDKIEDR